MGIFKGIFFILSPALRRDTVQSMGALVMAANSRRLSVDDCLFMMAFGRDADYHDSSPQHTYLDRHTGQVIWIFETDDDAAMEAGIPVEENRQERERVELDPDRYLVVPGLNHGDHHEILKAFFISDWTESEEQRRSAECAYFSSIGGWLKAVDDQDAIDGYFDFRDKRMRTLAEEFLQGNGIAPIWK
jgi:hypothetical protein